MRNQAKNLSFLLVFSLLLAACPKKAEDSKSTVVVQTEVAKTPPVPLPPPEPPKVKEEGIIPPGSGVEKEKPSPGTGNVQGKVFYNQLPAANIQVKLCETFNQFMGGCSGETFTAVTDANGEYLIKNVPPKLYEALTVQVFDTGFFIFATSGIMSAAKYKIEPDKTLFAPDSHLFKADLKFLHPPAGSQVDAAGLEIKWEPYPDAGYYKLSIHSDSMSGTPPVYDYINRRVDGTSFLLDKPLAPGTYRIKVEAFNRNGIKLADNGDETQFTVKGTAPVPPPPPPS